MIEAGQRVQIGVAVYAAATPWKLKSGPFRRVEAGAEALVLSTRDESDGFATALVHIPGAGVSRINVALVQKVLA